jgi:alkylation response protein AidB-like acyl-CoA dehydrogenase
VLIQWHPPEEPATCVNFDLSQDEEMLKAVAERFVTDRYDGERRRAALGQPSGFCADNWALLSDLGLIAMAFGEESGGLSASATDLAVVFEALGRGLVVEPLIESVLVAGKIFEAYAAPELKQNWMDDLVSGKRRLALAHRETRSRGNPAWVETQAIHAADGWRLSGTKQMVRAGVGADAVIVSARTSGAFGDGEGIELFLVVTGAPGMSSTAYRVIDGTVACEIALHDVAAEPLGAGLSAITTAEAKANIARCAEAVGIMEMLFATTIDYLRTRTQFGVPLGSFQALQHRMVAQYAVIEQARSLLYLAVMSGGDAIAGARAFISEVSVPLGHEMIQLHGGMGVTDELIIGHGHKRLMMLSRYPEDATAALDLYAGI